MIEVPWPPEPVEAKLQWTEGEAIGDLLFIGPDGCFAGIPVTWGDSDAATKQAGTNVWHIEVAGDIATVSPSIHFINHYHSPNPVKFKLVKELSHGR